VPPVSVLRGARLPVSAVWAWFYPQMIPDKNGKNLR
jgi:hypothetical protein